nr:STY0301 family protein [Variovorax guangxiensis]
MLTLLVACSGVPAVSAEVCPVRTGQPLRFVDVFDGKPEEMATLVPDETGKSSGHWSLGYIYEAGRVVTVRCKYADGQTSDVTLSAKTARCDYKINAKKTLALNCN